MDYLKTLEDKSIPLVVADPPYGIGAGCAIGGAVRAKTHEYHCYEDKAVDLNLLSELIRVGRHVVIWGANHFISRLSIDASCWLVWDKMNGATDFADIAAWELGIPYVGIERDKVYYDLQEQRFKEWTGQQLLDFSDVE